MTGRTAPDGPEAPLWWPCGGRVAARWRPCGGAVGISGDLRVASVGRAADLPTTAVAASWPDPTTRRAALDTPTTRTANTAPGETCVFAPSPAPHPTRCRTPVAGGPGVAPGRGPAVLVARPGRGTAVLVAYLWLPLQPPHSTQVWVQKNT